LERNADIKGDMDMDEEDILYEERVHERKLAKRSENRHKAEEHKYTLAASQHLFTKIEANFFTFS